MKKILSLLLAVIMAFSIPCTAFAAEATPEGEIISTFIGEDGYEYEYELDAEDGRILHRDKERD